MSIAGFQPDARELTREELEARGEQHFKLDQEIQEILATLREEGWQLAERLYRFEEESAWLSLDCESRQEWLARPEITMRYDGYMRMVRAWRELAVNRKIPVATLHAIDMSKVGIVLPAIKHLPKSTATILADAQQLGARDLREKYALPPAADDPADDDGDQEQDAADDDGEGAHAGIVVDDEPVTVADMEDEEVDITKVEVRLQAHRDWNALEEELLGAAESGQKNPRIDHRKIRVGLWGHEVIVEEARRGLDN